jgi:hypothetical protein
MRVPGGCGSQISRQSAHEGGKVVSPTHRLPLPAGDIPRTHFCYGLSQPQGHSASEGIMSPSGIEPATFRLVAQCLNQLCQHVPPILDCVLIKSAVCPTLKITVKSPLKTTRQARRNLRHYPGNCMVGRR